MILGGGVPKNYNLQPEPALGQMLGLPDVRGYHFDVQIVTAPVTDGSLSSCPPAEAVTWGKVDKDTYQQTTESMQADYSMVMPFLVKALLDNRERYAALAERLGEEELFRQETESARLSASARGLPFIQRAGRIVRAGCWRKSAITRNGCWRVYATLFRLTLENRSWLRPGRRTRLP